MSVAVGESRSRITSVGMDEEGLFANAVTDLADGVYSVKVIFKQTQVIYLLFN